MYVSAEQQSTMLVMNPELRIAIQVAGLENSFRRLPRERTVLALAGEQVLSKLLLTSTHAHYFKTMALWKVQVRYPLHHPVKRSCCIRSGKGCLKRVPS